MESHPILPTSLASLFLVVYIVKSSINIIEKFIFNGVLLTYLLSRIQVHQWLLKLKFLVPNLRYHGLVEESEVLHRSQTLGYLGYIGWTGHLVAQN